MSINDPLRKEYLRLRSQQANGEEGYYQITFLANDNGTLDHGLQTSWCGYTNTRPQREIRKGRLFHPGPQKEWLETFGQPCVIVNDEKDLHIFFLWGGAALIEKNVADRHLANLVGPRETMKDSSHLGFVYACHLPKSMKQHAPSRKLRMSVLERDEFRCRACGRSPANNVDVELHVHHIIPWGIGGITEKVNLITLCKTCHDGLDPHYMPKLSALQKCFSENDDNGQPHSRKEALIRGIKNYQRSLAKYLQENA